MQNREKKLTNGAVYIQHRRHAMIESTGHKPTEQERAVEAVYVALVRIRQQVNAALLAVEEIKSNTEVRR